MCWWLGGKLYLCVEEIKEMKKEKTWRRYPLQGQVVRQQFPYHHAVVRARSRSLFRQNGLALGLRCLGQGMRGGAVRRLRWGRDGPGGGAFVEEYGETEWRRVVACRWYGYGGRFPPIRGSGWMGMLRGKGARGDVLANLRHGRKIWRRRRVRVDEKGGEGLGESEEKL